MKRRILVLGSGPIRIGQGIEFDYSCVHCVWALQHLGFDAIIVNNNPETVSTDFDTGNGLYFEPVTLEDVLKIVAHERVEGVVCQFGGQTAINLAQPLANAGVQVLGTSPKAIAMAEDREQFDDLLERLGVARPKGKGVRNLSEAVEIAREIGFPVIVRPSFVLGGRAMEVCHDEDHLRRFYGEAEAENPGQPVLVDQYLRGVEAEVDVISDGVSTLVPGIMEHIERAGVHSGDSMAVYPPVSLSSEIQAKMVGIACDLARALEIKGLMNIQFVVDRGEVFVIEVNPRASRTVPYLSKVAGIRMVDLATHCMMGRTLAEMGYESGLWAPDPTLKSEGLDPEPYTPGAVIPESEVRGGSFQAPTPILYAVKAPVFSFQKLSRVEPTLGPEMKSTGEIMGVDFTFEAALYKALVASGITFKGQGRVVLTVSDEDKPKAVEIARELVSSGYRLAATEGTARPIQEAGMDCLIVSKIGGPAPNLLDLTLSGQVAMMINTPTGSRSTDDAQRIRRAGIEVGIPVVTNIDTAGALARALTIYADPSKASCLRVDEYLAGRPKAAKAVPDAWAEYSGDA